MCPLNRHTCLIYQVIKLTKELIGSSADELAPPAHAASTSGHDGGTDAQPYAAPKAAPVAAITAAPDIRVGIALPPQVAQQIRTARQRAAVIGQAPPEWAIGADVEALYAGDEQWCGRLQSVRWRDRSESAVFHFARLCVHRAGTRPR